MSSAQQPEQPRARFRLELSEQLDGRWRGVVPEVPDLVADGDTLDEAARNLVARLSAELERREDESDLAVARERDSEPNLSWNEVFGE